jgi:hypothetical protein
MSKKGRRPDTATPSKDRSDTDWKFATSKDLVNHLSSKWKSDPNMPAMFDGSTLASVIEITDEERRFLSFLASRWSESEIAMFEQCTVSHVENVIDGLCERLSVKSRAELIELVS